MEGGRILYRYKYSSPVATSILVCKTTTHSDHFSSTVFQVLYGDIHASNVLQVGVLLVAVLQ